MADIKCRNWVYLINYFGIQVLYEKTNHFKKAIQSEVFGPFLTTIFE